MQAITEREETTFWGREMADREINSTIADHFESITVNDMADIAYEQKDAILSALKDGDLCEVGRIIQQEVCEVARRCASREIYGNPAVLQPTSAEMLRIMREAL